MARLTYFRKDGSSSIVPHMLLQELGLPFRDQPMKATPEGYTPIDTSITRTDFLRLNPAGLVPTILLDDGTVITEMPAVLTYIASLKPEREMMGKPVLEHVKVLEWIAWLMGNLNEYGFAGYWAPHRMVARDAPQIVQDAVRAHGHETIIESFERVEENLDGSGHAVGGRLTVIDMLLHTFWRWGMQAEIDMSKYAKFRNVAKQLESFESVRATLAVENVQLGTWE